VAVSSAFSSYIALPTFKRTLSPVRLVLEDSSKRSFMLFVVVSLQLGNNQIKCSSPAVAAQWPEKTGFGEY
jgi:hypothetical protein